MVAVCRFLQKQYAQAEGPLLKVVRSKDATPYELGAAARGLIGVYQKLGRGADQLHAAFLYEKTGGEYQMDPYGFERYSPCIPEWAWLLDLPYILDVQLSDDELREYLQRYGKEARGITYRPRPKKRTAFDTVEYELAVRFARHEKYGEAAGIYERLNAIPRAKRMRVLAGLYEKANDAASSPEVRLKAQYEYASFLEAHSTQVFFNDMVWGGFQTWTFTNGDEDEFRGPMSAEWQGITNEERDRFMKQERNIRDNQEERWRAYGILSSVVDRTGDLELGRQAATKAIRCLDLIAVHRFGRADEIDRDRANLIAWLRSHKRHAEESKT
jgi:hypothetical protein